MRLESEIDPSVNFIEQQLEGFLESRYVRKVPEYFICYLSSQSGCNHACRMCWLTATGQNKGVKDTTPEQYLEQAKKVLEHYLTEDQAKFIHYNFMARGEALANTHILNNADEILYSLGKLAVNTDSNLGVRFNISTILPNTLDKPLEEIFKVIHPTIYYSLYSVDETFRKKWLPKALPVKRAFELLQDYQTYSKKKIKIHHCFIEGENDSEEDVLKVCDYIFGYGLDVEFNLVRYNPYSAIQGKESSDEVIKRNLKMISDRLGFTNVKVIPRVGIDVMASCGTFVGGKRHVTNRT